MKRLTNTIYGNVVVEKDKIRTCDKICEEYSSCVDCPIEKAFKRLVAIENILGDNYDLDKLQELLLKEQEVSYQTTLPSFAWRIGETRGIIKVPYKPWMERYMGTKFYRTEKEAFEANLKNE